MKKKKQDDMFHRNAPNIHISILAEMIIFLDPFDTRWAVKDPFVLFTEPRQRDRATSWVIGLRIEDVCEIMCIFGFR